MERTLDATRFLLPLGLAIAAGVVQSPAGGGPELLVLAVLGGASLGVFLQLFLASLAALLGRARQPVSGEEAVRLLERDKRITLRSLKDIELDVSLGRLDEAEARELSLPLRERAMRILREIDNARVAEGAADPLGAEIEREIARRADRLAEAEAETAEETAVEEEKEETAAEEEKEETAAEEEKEETAAEEEKEETAAEEEKEETAAEEEKEETAAEEAPR